MRRSMELKILLVLPFWTQKLRVGLDGPLARIVQGVDTLLSVSGTQLQNHLEFRQLGLSFDMQIDLISDLQLVRLRRKLALKCLGLYPNCGSKWLTKTWCLKCLKTT